MALIPAVEEDEFPALAPGDTAGRAPLPHLSERPPSAVRDPEPKGVPERAPAWSDLVEYQQVESKPPTPEMPLIEARVVYMGADTKHSVSLPGYVHVERTWGDTERTILLDEKRMVVSGQGTEVYDFWTHDTIGRPIPEHLIPYNAKDPTLGGRPIQLCRHPEHLRYFHYAMEGGRRAYVLLIKPSELAKFDHYVLKRESYEAPQRDLTTQVAGAPRAPEHTQFVPF